MRVVVAAMASLGALTLLTTLFIILRYNPSKLPLESVGITNYTILDSDASNRGWRSADLTVAPRTCATNELRDVARDIKQKFRPYDYVSVLFYRRLPSSPCRKVAVIGLTEKGLERAGDIEGEPLSGSRNGDGVFLFGVPR